MFYMVMSFESVIFYLFLIDSIGANIVAFFYPKWYAKKYRGFAKLFPLTKGWTIFYLILVLWIGCALYRLGVL